MDMVQVATIDPGFRSGDIDTQRPPVRDGLGVPMAWFRTRPF